MLLSALDCGPPAPSGAAPWSIDFPRAADLAILRLTVLLLPAFFKRVLSLGRHSSFRPRRTCVRPFREIETPETPALPRTPNCRPGSMGREHPARPGRPGQWNR